MPLANNNGCKIEYEYERNENEETIVFVNGLGYEYWMWDQQLPALTDFDVIRWNLRGVGDSDAPEGPYSILDFASDLDAVLEDADVEQAHLVGISLGGMIVQKYVTEYNRAKSMTLISTTVGRDGIDPDPEVAQRTVNAPDDLSPRESLRYKMKVAFSDSFWKENQDVISDIIDQRLQDDIPPKVYEWQAHTVPQFDIGDDLSDVAIPSLILAGKEDIVVPPENSEILAENLVNSTVKKFSGGHLFIIENASEVNDSLVQFLESISNETSIPL